MMSGSRRFVSGDEAIALAVRLIKPHVIAAYPITPQTIVVERLSDFVEDGSLCSEYLHVESEHSALAACMGACAVGARTFTATSSQGLLYMVECLHYASGCRFPIVMMNANRSLAAPWSIFGDQRDSLSQLDCGWLQAYAEDAQDSLDLMLQAYRIAEDASVLTPVMVNLDGFVLTHTYEVVEVPNAADVDKYLPPYKPAMKMDFENPMSVAISAGPLWHTEFRLQQQQAALHAREVIHASAIEFDKIFGRNCSGLVEEYRCEDAEVVLATLGSVVGTARLVVDELREKGAKVGLVKLRWLRPFPIEEVASIGERVKALGVLEKNISFGYEGSVFSEVNSALARNRNMPVTVNFVAGLAGRDITREDLIGMVETLMKAARGEKTDRVIFSQARCG